MHLYSLKKPCSKLTWQMELHLLSTGNISLNFWWIFHCLYFFTRGVGMCHKNPLERWSYCKSFLILGRFSTGGEVQFHQNRCQQYHNTVDGRNPANHVGWCSNPVNNGLNHQPQLVEDFFHQRNQPAIPKSLRNSSSTLNQFISITFYHLTSRTT